MSHHFLHHYNAYHIVIVKPSLPHLYLYYIQKISAQVTRYFPKLPSITAKAARYLVPFPLPHPGNAKTIAQVLYLYHIQNFTEQFSPYLPKLASTTAKDNAYLVGAGAVWSGVGTLGSPSSRPPYHIPGMLKPSLKYFTSTVSKTLARNLLAISQISEHDSKGQCVPRRGGGGIEWCGDPWVALVLSPLPPGCALPPKVLKYILVN